MLKHPYIRYFGRVLPAAGTDAVYMDWSLTGFEVEFEGSRLDVSFIADHGIEPTSRFGAGSEPQRPLWPMIGVMVGDSDELVRRIMIDEAVKTVTVFDAATDLPAASAENASDLTSDSTARGAGSANSAGNTGSASAHTSTRHRVRVIKLTENLKCGLELTNVSCDGTFLEVTSPVKPVIEIIGDSITCGFGNESPDPAHAFFAEEENGWMAYGAILAKKLGMQPQILATSGACLSLNEWNGRPYPIRDLYEYTDRPREDNIFRICPDSNMTLVPEGLPETHAVKWDFAAHPVDTVVLNLGTNDADACNYYDDPRAMALQWEDDYLAFIKMIRALNGPDTKIVCALGDMRYYLWEHISSAVMRYIAETGDEKIRLVKLNGIRPGERRGAGTHPSVATDIRMAAQLEQVVRSF